MDQVRAPFYCVDSIYEAYELLKIEVKTPILIMGYIDPENLKVKKLPFSYSVFDLKMLSHLANYQPDCRIHLFIDTGMNREGVALEQLSIYLDQIKKLPQIKFEGLMSHLASAELMESVQNLRQIKNFNIAKDLVKKYNLHPKWFHLFASKGILQNRFTKLKNLTNMARVGMAIFGIDPLGVNENLKPVVKLKSKIVQIKRVGKGELVGYSGTFKAKKDMILGILPLGYNDGVDRRLSNRGSVKVASVVCPIIGIVSMNITTIDITNVLNPKIGDEVVVFSNTPSDPNSLENAAKICKTIPYEILVHLAPSTKRVVV